MNRHPLDPIALVFGLLFTFAGLAVLADQTWDGTDAAAVTGIGVAVVGVTLAVAVLTRAINDPSTDTDPAETDSEGPPLDR